MITLCLKYYVHNHSRVLSSSFDLIIPATSSFVGILTTSMSESEFTHTVVSKSVDLSIFRESRVSLLRTIPLRFERSRCEEICIEPDGRGSFRSRTVTDLSFRVLSPSKQMSFLCDDTDMSVTHTDVDRFVQFKSNSLTFTDDPFPWSCCWNCFRSVRTSFHPYETMWNWWSWWKLISTSTLALLVHADSPSPLAPWNTSSYYRPVSTTTWT